MGWLPVTRAVWSATGLPDGVSIDRGTGAISGRPTHNGLYAPIIRVETNWGEREQVMDITVWDSLEPKLIQDTRLNLSFKYKEYPSYTDYPRVDLNDYVQNAALDHAKGITRVEWKITNGRKLTEYEYSGSGYMFQVNLIDQTTGELQICWGGKKGNTYTLSPTFRCATNYGEIQFTYTIRISIT